jgi:hypothetical protein
VRVGGYSPLKGAIRTSNQNAWQARLAADFGTQTNSFEKLGIGKFAMKFKEI